MCRYHCVLISGNNNTFLSKSYDGKSVETATQQQIYWHALSARFNDMTKYVIYAVTLEITDNA